MNRNTNSTLLLRTWLQSPSWTRIRWQTTENGRHSHPTTTVRSTWTFCTSSNVSPGHVPHAGHHPSHPPPASSSGGHPPPPQYAHYPAFHAIIKQEDKEERMKYHYPPTGPLPHRPPPTGPYYGPFPPPPVPGFYRPSVSESFSTSEAGSKRSSPRRPGAGSAAARDPWVPSRIYKLFVL